MSGSVEITAYAAPRFWGRSRGLCIGLGLGLMLWGACAQAQLLTEDLTTGFRFSPPISTVAEAPSDPRVAYVGTSKGFVYATRDGGATWVEYEVLPPRERFFGSIRSFGRFLHAGGFGVRSRFSRRFRHMLSFTEPDMALDRSNGDVPGRAARARYNPDRLFDFDVKASRSGAGGDTSVLGVGLSAGAPRLAGRVRRASGWGIGVNLKQTLALAGTPSTWINHLDVDPRDPNTILAGTGDGLRRSTDGGASWPLVLSGPTLKESRIYCLARAPNDPDLVIAGSGVGLYRSYDGGKTFTRFIDPYVTAEDINWVSFHPTEPNRFLVSLTWGLLETTNAKDFKLIYIDTWAPLSYVRKAIYDPHQPTRVFAATKDGLVVADDGKTFVRSGGMQFVGTELIGISPGGRPGVFRVLTDRDIWETSDGGKTWRALLFGGIEWAIVYGLASRHDPGTLWVLTEAEVLRLRPGRARRAPAGLERAYRETIKDEPSVGQAVARALDRAGASVTEQFAYRARARWSAVLPEVYVGYEAFAFNTRGLNSQVLQPDGTFAQFDRDGVVDRPGTFLALLRWDLIPLVHDSAESTANRVGGINRSLEWRIRSTTVNLFEERRRLMLQALVRPGDARSHLMRNLRLEELTAHLNALTGDLFAPVSAL